MFGFYYLAQKTCDLVSWGLYRVGMTRLSHKMDLVCVRLCMKKWQRRFRHYTNYDL